MNELLRLEVSCEWETWVLEAANPAVLGTLASGIRRAMAAGRLRGYLATVTMEAREQEDGALMVAFTEVRRGLEYLETLGRVKLCPCTASGAAASSGFLLP